MVKATCTTMLLFVMINDYRFIVAVQLAFVIYCVSVSAANTSKIVALCRSG